MKFDTSKERIDAFLQGSNPMERVIKLEIGYDDDKVKILYRDSKGHYKCQTEEFYPFVWAKQSTARGLFNGNRQELKKKMSQYGITCKGLIVEDENGDIADRMNNGYRVMFYSQGPMSFSKFMDFFIDGGRPIYPKISDKNYGLKDYIVVAPNEQHMITNGLRLFKGYDDYDDLIRFVFDLETEGLDPSKDMISQIGIRTNKGYEKLIKINGEGEDKFNNELIGLDEFFNIIAQINPDIISGHNTENFDWNFIDIRLQKHGSNLQEFTSSKFGGNGMYKKKKQSVLKLGGEIEYFYPTVKYGTNLTDSLHAVRRAQAIDSNIKKADLKYITKFAKLNKTNRVYIPGKLINETWLERRKIFAFNDKNGEWFKLTEKQLSKTIIKKEFNTTTFKEEEIVSPRYEFIDGKAKLIDNKTDITYEMVSGEYIGERYLMDDLYEADKVELQFNVSNFLVAKMLPVSYEKVCTMGTAAIWKYIMLAWSYENNLAIPEIIGKKSFVGGLSRLIKVGFVDNIVKLDYNSLYPSIILTFGINNNVDISNIMLHLLEYILSQREYYKGLKGQYGKQIDELKANGGDKKLIAELSAKKMGADKIQLPLKILANSYFGASSSGEPFPWTVIETAEQTTCTGRMMLRLMIYHFSHLSIFNGANLSQEFDYQPIVGDTDGFNFRMPNKFRYTDNNPYIGQGLGRNVKQGKKYTLVDADVAEFEDTYINTPYNNGILKNGLGIDEYCKSCIQFSRKNYSDLMMDDSIKLVGNSIKSKKMPIYIEKFLDKGIRLLLNGQGKDFLELYYDYIEEIYNLRIPLQDIATVGKIKTSIKEYKSKCNERTKSGSKRSRQAWYELAIADNLDVNMGDTIYYINTSTKKGASDVQRITKFYYMENGNKIDYVKNENGEPLRDKKGNIVELTKKLTNDYNKFKKEAKERNETVKMTIFEFGRKQYPNLQEEDEVIFNCVRLSNDIVEDEDPHYCDDKFEYNKDKYIDMFNKRIRPLLVCFDKSIRTTYTVDKKGDTKELDNILISKPSERKAFTEEESVLVSGQPYNTFDQDTYEQLMTIEDKEIKFWLSINEIPPYVKECGIDWEEVVREYKDRLKQYEEESIKQEVEEYNKILENFNQKELDNLIENGILPDKLSKIVDLDIMTNDLISKKHNIKIGSLIDLLEFDFGDNDIDE